MDDPQVTAMLNNPEFGKTVEEAVVRALGRGASEGRYIDIGRIPFICDDISKISTALEVISKTQETLKDSLASYPIVKMLVFGLVGAILTGALILAGYSILVTISHATQLNVSL